MGCVTAGVMKGCQAVAVFVASHFLYCSIQSSQCFSMPKAWSLVLVVVGTTAYALGSRRNGEQVDSTARYHKFEEGSGAGRSARDIVLAQASSAFRI